MNKHFFIIIVITILSIANVLAQSTVKGKPMEIKYRISSLHTILIESDRFPYKDTVLRAYYNAPFPDKYNEHTIGEKSFNPNLYRTGSTSQNDDYKSIIDNYFSVNKIANKLVAKWFDRKADGTMDMNLIGQRGSYNATEMAAKIASNSARGSASLADAGEELIGNTFVVVSKLNFVSNEYAAAIIREAAYAAASRLPYEALQQIAQAIADQVYEKTKEGYSVWTTSYLYKLKWNDSIAAVFYNDLWMDQNTKDTARRSKFDNTSIFGMEYVGSEKSSSLVTFSLKETRTEEKTVEIATVRNIDAVYAKLQKKYDIFKTKTPLYTGFPITAKIGLKEGIQGGDKYEVLEQTLDADGKTKYVKKGIIKVNKNQIWDNRFVAGEKQMADSSIINENQKIDRTLFKGGKNYYAGMLIRQIK